MRKQARPARTSQDVLDLTILSEDDIPSPRGRGCTGRPTQPRRPPARSSGSPPCHGSCPRSGTTRRQRVQAVALAALASCKDDENLARQLQDEENRRVAEAEQRLQRRMDALERQEAAAEASSSALLGSLFGGHGRQRSSASAAAGAAAAARARGEVYAALAPSHTTAPRSAGRRRGSGRWGEGLSLAGGLLGGPGGPGPIGSLFSGGGGGLGGGGGHPHPHRPYMPAHLAALQQVVGGAQSGLPPHLLLSDRDFTDGERMEGASSPLALSCRLRAPHTRECVSLSPSASPPAATRSRLRAAAAPGRKGAEAWGAA